MCDKPGSGELRFDPDTGHYRSVVLCGCGELDLATGCVITASGPDFGPFKRAIPNLEGPLEQIRRFAPHLLDPLTAC